MLAANYQKVEQDYADGVINNSERIIEAGLQSTDPRVKAKHEWLKMYKEWHTGVNSDFKAFDLI